MNEIMQEEMYKEMAAQLRKPIGEYALMVGEKMNEGNLLINQYTIELLRPTKGDSILEIGMGNGYFVKDILKIDPSITYAGCDHSDLMVKEANKINAVYVNSERASFHLSEADAIPFANAAFNKIFTVNTIYFWDDMHITLAEIRRVLKPNGLLFISLRPKQSMEAYPFAKYGFNMFTEEDLFTTLTDNSFKVRSASQQDEPEQEINGLKIKVESLIICAEKSN